MSLFVFLSYNPCLSICLSVSLRSEIIVSSGVVEGLTVCPQWLDISNVPGYLSRGVVMYFGKYGKTIRLRDVLIRYSVYNFFAREIDGYRERGIYV